ncbi:MAG: GGDEF domain-containing protein [Actinoplanes sp.]
MSSQRHWFVATAGTITVAHLLLPADSRAFTYLLAAALAVPPIVMVLRRSEPGSRAPWWLLFAAMSMLTVGNSISAFAGSALNPVVEIFVTVGHVLLLAAAVALVLRRGRNDIGGMLDVAVAAIALGGLLWTALLLPRLEQLGSGPGSQVSILVTILVLAGVLGALLRLWLTDRRLPALGLLLTALGLALIGNVAMAATTGQMTVGRSNGIETLFMIAYGCVGLSMLDPSVDELNRPSAAPVDGLTTKRLIFLGVALTAIPVVGGMREMLGLSADGPLLAVGTLLLTPLVMIRVGRLARQRARAEEALRHRATHDLLTGLPNRAELLVRLAAALRSEQVAGHPSVVLLFCDLNGFKQVNDRYGHVAGDQLLTQVGARIRAGLRAEDTLARYGGDEFLLLCSDTSQQEAAARLGAHVERALAEPFRLPAAPVEVTVGASIGTVLSTGTLDADELISQADEQMYAAKERHRAALR